MHEPALSQRLCCRVLQPEDVQAGFVPQHQVGWVVRAPADFWSWRARRGRAAVSTGRVAQAHELLRVRALQGLGLQREVLVGAQVVDPELLGPGCLAGRLLVEEQHLGLCGLGIEQAGEQPQQREQIASMRQLAAKLDATEPPMRKGHVLLTQRISSGGIDVGLAAYFANAQSSKRTRPTTAL